MRRAPLMIAALVPALLVGIAGCALLPAQATPLERAAEECGINSSPFARIGDDGHSLTLDHRGKEDAGGLDFIEVECVLVELEMPDAAYERMMQTSSLDGFQNADWDGITATWSYHPDDGMSVILEVEE